MRTLSSGLRGYASSVIICPACGEENLERARFCHRCAAPLAAPSEGEQRKTVTVLFCDVMGSTALGERLDPESLRRVMRRYFDVVREAIERHGGTVEKFIGDAVMAVFGVPRLHEDDALRAVRAAAEAREAIAALGKELEAERDVTLLARIGVNTGEVVAGDATTGQALVTGDAVNVAARLEQAATPGEVLIGVGTYRLVRDAAVVEPVDPIEAKGKAERLQAFRLVAVHPTAAGVSRRLDSPLVGRERELALLRQAFDRAVAERSCHLLTVLGTAGVGKSRLVQELLGTLVDPRVLRGRCLPYGEGITFFPVVELLKQAAGIADFEDPIETERKVCEVIAGEEHGELVCARLGHLLGLAEGEAVPDETFWAIRRLLEALARERPLVVVLDDIQWGEAAFLDLVEYVADWTRDAPIQLVCLARPELLDIRPGWGGGKLNASSIVLEPLPDEQCGQLVANLLGAEAVAQEVRERVLAAAEGNPLFVEQMVSMLIDDGLLARDDGRWVPAGDLSAVVVPPTIHALLAARLDRLSTEERVVVQRASVVGKVFFRGAVAHLSHESERPAVAGHLMSLVRKDLVRPDRTTLPGEDAFRFRHLLIRDAAYESLPKEQRAELHERFADWLEEVAGERVEEQQEILGYHLEQAYRLREQLGPVDDRARALGRRAATHLAASGTRASDRGDVGGAANLLARAVGSLQRGDRDRLGLLPGLGSALVEAGRYEDASAILREAIEEAHAAGDGLTEAHARVTEVFVRVYADPEGSGVEATRVADELIPVFRAADDHLGLARAYRLRCTGPWMFSRYAEMTADAERAAEHASRAGDPGEQRLALDMAAVGLTFGPVPVEEVIGRLDALRETAAGRQRHTQRTAMAVPYAMQGRFDEARQILAEGRAMFEDLGRASWVASHGLALGIVELLADDPVAAERSLRQGRDEFLAIGERGVLSTLSAYLAWALCLQGRFDEAEPFIEESRELASSEDVASQAGWRQARAWVLLGRGALQDAAALAREALEHAMRGDGPDEQASAIDVLAQVVAAAGRTDEAAELLRQAIELWDRKGNVVSAGRARARLAELGR